MRKDIVNPVLEFQWLSIEQTFKLVRGFLINLASKPKIPLTWNIINLFFCFLLTNNKKNIFKKEANKKIAWIKLSNKKTRPILPANNFRKCLNIAINHLLFGSPLTTRFIHNNKPVLIITTREKRGHLIGWPVTKVWPWVQGRVTRVSSSVDPASNGSEAGGVSGFVDGLESVREWG